MARTAKKSPGKPIGAPSASRPAAIRTSMSRLPAMTANVNRVLGRVPIGGLLAQAFEELDQRDHDGDSEDAHQQPGRGDDHEGREDSPQQGGPRFDPPP